MSTISKVLNAFKWLWTAAIDHTKQVAAVAVTVTETIKAILNNPVSGFLGQIVDSLTHTSIGTAGIAAINAVIPKVLAAELAIEGLPDNATEADILAFEQRILGAFNVNTSNSKLYTTLAAQIYGIIKADVDGGKTSFADWVIAIEEVYQDYKADSAAFDIGVVNAPVGTKLADGNIVLSEKAA